MLPCKLLLYLPINKNKRQPMAKHVDILKHLDTPPIEYRAELRKDLGGWIITKYSQYLTEVGKSYKWLTGTINKGSTSSMVKVFDTLSELREVAKNIGITIHTYSQVTYHILDSGALWVYIDNGLSATYQEPKDVAKILYEDFNTETDGN